MKTNDNFSLQSSSYFITGGSLPPEAPSYVARKADEDLYQSLSSGQFCYVLDSRQVGKSSLMVRVASRLRNDGVRVTVLDLSSLGQNVSIEQWYFGLLYSIAEMFNLDARIEDFWVSNTNLSPVQRWMSALRDIILANDPSPLVIFVDEIDTVRSLPFSADEFFAAIRECANRRSEQMKMERLTFCLLGVAIPSNLIRNPYTTPFNIGRRIDLSDFSEEEVTPLMKGLEATGRSGQTLIKRILYWTGGHPYLTQRLCRAVVEDSESRTPHDVDRICSATFLTPQAERMDDNLAFARNRFLLQEEGVDQVNILLLYAKILKGKTPIRFEPTDIMASILRLAGVVKEEDGILRSRNRIYKRVFSKKWIYANMPGEEVRRQRKAETVGFLRATIFWLLMLILVWFAFHQTIYAKQTEMDAKRVMFQNRLLTHSTVILQTGMTKLKSAIRGEMTFLTDARRKKTAAEKQLSFVYHTTHRLEAQFQLQKNEVKLERERGRKNALYIDSMSGRIASAFATNVSTGVEALEYGLRAVEPALRQHQRPSLTAVEGLANAVNRGIFLRLTLKHPVPIFCASFSHNAHRILTAGKGKYAYIWDAKNGKLLQTLLVQRKPNAVQNINSAVFSRDGKYILTASDESGVQLWNARGGESDRRTPVWTAPPDSQIPVMTAAISDDSRYVVTVAMHNLMFTARVYDLHNHTSWLLCKDPSEMDMTFLWSVAISHDDQEVVTGGNDGIIKVWGLKSGKLLKSFVNGSQVSPTNEPSPILCVNFAWFNQLILFSDKQGMVRAWEWRENRIYKNYLGQRDWVWDVEGSSWHTYVASGGKDNLAFVWATDGNQSPIYTINAHSGPVMATCFSPDSRELVTASQDHTAKVWLFTNQIQFSTGAIISDVSFNKKGDEFYFSSYGGDLKIVNRKTNVQRMYVISPSAITHCDLSPDGKEIAAACVDGVIRIWRVTSSSVTPDLLRQFQTNDGAAESVQYSPDGKIMLTAGYDGSVSLWDVRTGERIIKMTGHLGNIYTALFSPNAKRIISSSRDGSSIIWDAKTGRILFRLLPPGRMAGNFTQISNHPYMACFSPNGKIAVAADSDHHVYFWNSHTGDLIGKIQGGLGEALCAVFNRKGDKIAIGDMDGSIRIWNVSDVLATWKKHRMANPIMLIHNKTGAINWLDYSPNGNHLLVGNNNHSVTLIHATPETYVNAAKQILSYLNGTESFENEPAM